MGAFLTAKFFRKLPGEKIGKARCIMVRKIRGGSGVKTTNMRNKAKQLRSTKRKDRNRVI